MTCRRFAPCALLALACGAGTARADFQWLFADSTGTPQSAFTLNSVGGTVDIQVYLVASGATDIATLQNDGLVSAGVRLNYPAGVAAVISPSNITPNPAFDDTTSPKVATPTFASLNAAVFLNPPVKAPSPATVPNDRILIGTFTFTDINVGTITVTTSDPHPGTFQTGGLDDTVTGTGAVLDDLIMNSAITITAVPEPGSLALGGLAALGVAGGVWRRRRRAAA